MNNTESDLIGNAVMLQFLEHDGNYDVNFSFILFQKKTREILKAKARNSETFFFSSEIRKNEGG